MVGRSGQRERGLWTVISPALVVSRNEKQEVVTVSIVCKSLASLTLMNHSVILLKLALHLIMHDLGQNKPPTLASMKYNKQPVPTWSSRWIVCNLMIQKVIRKNTQANPYPGNQIYIVSHTNIWLCITEDFQNCMMGILWWNLRFQKRVCC